MELNAQLKLASSINELRRLKGYTQTYIADRLHMSRSTYALLESGKRHLSVDVLMDISDFYDVSLTALVSAEKKQLFNVMDYTDIYKMQLVKLVDIYHQLSPYMRGCLMERAEVLLTTDAT